jgi:hypothetical protein
MSSAKLAVLPETGGILRVFLDPAKIYILDVSACFIYVMIFQSCVNNNPYPAVPLGCGRWIFWAKETRRNL